jgi:hypothetical protein
VNLDLPPRRELPFEVRERMRARVAAGLDAEPGRADRLRGPLAVAAGVTVIAAASVAILAQSTAGSGHSSGSTPTGRPTTTTAVPTLPDPVLTTGKAEDLDRCWNVVQTSPRMPEFGPRQNWKASWATALNGHRITAFRAGDRPMFCDTTTTTATVSDPTAEPMPMLAEDTDYHGPAEPHALYLSPAGVLTGVAPGASRLQCTVGILDATTSGPGTRYGTRLAGTVVQDGMFAMWVGDLKDGDELRTATFDAADKLLSLGGFRFERAHVRPVGATGTNR